MTKKRKSSKTPTEPIPCHAYPYLNLLATGLDPEVARLQSRLRPWTLEEYRQNPAFVLREQLVIRFGERRKQRLASQQSLPPIDPAPTPPQPPPALPPDPAPPPPDPDDLRDRQLADAL